jgi:hypothetical protein
VKTPEEPNTFVTPKEDLPEHYAAVGRVIIGFSNIERALNETLRFIINVSEEVSRAVTGEMRAVDLISAIRRVVRARERDAIISGAAKPPNPPAMEPLFVEIHNLKLVRDHIAHHRFFVFEREMIFTNTDTARSSIDAQFNHYTVDDLNEMAAYAERLVKRVYRLRPALFLHNAASGMTRDRSLLEIPVRLQNKSQSRAVRRKQKRQSQSSQEQS